MKKLLIPIGIFFALFGAVAVNNAAAAAHNSDARRQAIEERIAAAHQRICTRLLQVQSRIGRPISLPEFCDNGGNNNSPATLSFSAAPLSISAGGTSTLAWDSTNATICRASGGWTGTKTLDGTLVVTPATTTTYSLACGNQYGTTTQSKTVSVTPVVATGTAPELTFDGNPLAITSAGSSTLSWDSTNATLCRATGGWSGTKALDGTQVVSPNATTTYTLACGNTVGTTTKNVTISVATTSSTTTPTTTPMATLVFTAAPTTTVTMNGISTLTWDSTNATYCVASGGWSGAKTLDGTLVVTPATTTTYTLACGNQTGTTTESRTVTVTIPITPIPTVLLEAATSSLVLGASTTLSWSSTNATTCTASGGWLGAKSTTSSQSIAPATTTTYVLSCNGVGGTATDTASVTVTTPVATSTGARMVITEVYYDTDGTHGSEPQNEWVELYNAGDAPIDIVGWTIGDTAATDTIATSSLATLVVNPGKYIWITPATSTAAFWSVPASALSIVLGSSIGSNGFTNTGEVTYLRNQSGVIVDSVSWGSSTSAFSPSVPVVDAGHSITRTNPSAPDTNTNADWSDDATPTPGE